MSRVELHLPASRSLKAKRSVVGSLVRRIDQMHGAGCAEVDHQDLWQRSALGVTTVAATVGQVEKLMDSIERLIWSRSEVEVLDIRRSWWEDE
ncbi:MAG: DUF503 domain-containing protein [Acidimicrobiia bacterium]|nr:DUF503 domain-containing protein [Acidimicrobiia bacterium]